MKEVFVKTKNVKLLESGIKEIRENSVGGEHILLVAGKAGLGKSHAAMHHAAHNKGTAMIRVLELMRGSWLLRDTLKELGVEPEHRVYSMFNQIISLQMGLPKDKKRLLIFDEIDRITNKPEILETIRDLHDVCQCPIVLIGEEKVDTKLIKNRRFYRRIVDVIRFEDFDRAGVAEVIEQLSEVKFDSKAIDKAHEVCGGMISGVLNVIKDAERAAASNNLSVVKVENLWKN